jgi:hypothetical protein
MIDQQSIFSPPPTGIIHDRLEELYEATKGFAESNDGLLSYIALSETAPLLFSKHLLSLSGILENYHHGIFDDQDFIPHGCVHGPAYSYVEKERAADVVKSAIERTYGRVFSVNNDMVEYEQNIKAELKMIEVYFHTLRDLEKFQSECILLVKKIFPLKSYKTEVLSGLQNATLLLQAAACPTNEVVGRVTLFVRLIHGHAAEEMNKPSKKSASSGNGWHGLSHMCSKP